MQILSKVENLTEIQKGIKNRISNIEKILNSNKDNDDGSIKAIKIYQV